MNKKELRAYMARYGDSNQTLAQALSLSPTSLSEKINGKRDFVRREIAIIKRRYNLTPEENDNIFFSQEVD